MPNVKFNLKNKSDEESLVIMIFRYDGNRLVYSTGQKISPKFWNDKNQKARENSKFPEFPEFNAYLKNIELETQNIYRRYRIDSKELNIATFKNELDEVLGKKEKSTTPTLLEFINLFIEQREKEEKPAGSIQVYKKTLKHLIGYTKHYGLINYYDIDFDFLDKFKNYLYSEPRNLSLNYSLKLLQNLKMFMNEAKDLEYHNNIKYKNRKFSIKKEEISHIYLNQEELDKINTLNLNNNPKLDRVRDLFLIGCYTGLRFSDFNKLKPQHFKTIGKVEVIEIITTKTKQKVIIPVHSIAKRIIEKYNGFLPSLSNQKMNDYIKEVCELAGIDESITNIRTKGYNKREETKPKFDLVSSHTARRSFASNAYKAGIPSLAIRSITGHKTESSFLKYIKVTQEEQAAIMANNAFFQ
jgi:integrase